MASKSLESMQRVVAILAEAGYVDAGATESVMMPSAATHFVGGRAVGGRLSPGRRRLSLPGTDRRATVGARTVCLYRVAEKQATDFQTFKTSDVEAIRAAASGAGPSAEGDGGGIDGVRGICGSERR